VPDFPSGRTVLQAAGPHAHVVRSIFINPDFILFYSTIGSPGSCNAVPQDGDDWHRQYDNCENHRYFDGVHRICRLELGGFNRFRKFRSVSIVLEAERLAV
jgi:hypothetical protein